MYGSAGGILSETWAFPVLSPGYGVHDGAIHAIDNIVKMRKSVYQKQKRKQQNDKTAKHNICLVRHTLS